MFTNFEDVNCVFFSLSRFIPYCKSSFRMNRLLDQAVQLSDKASMQFNRYICIRYNRN